MGGLLQLPVAKFGQCMVTPSQVGLVTECSVALLLLEQPESDRRDACTCHAADYRDTHRESRILIIDCEGEQHVFPVVTKVLTDMLGFNLAQIISDGVSCTRLQGNILKLTERGNARAALIRRLGRC